MKVFWEPRSKSTLTLSKVKVLLIVSLITIKLMMADFCHLVLQSMRSTTKKICQICLGYSGENNSNFGVESQVVCMTTTYRRISLCMSNSFWWNTTPLWHRYQPILQNQRYTQRIKFSILGEIKANSGPCSRRCLKKGLLNLIIPKVKGMGWTLKRDKYFFESLKLRLLFDGTSYKEIIWSNGMVHRWFLNQSYKLSLWTLCRSS